ncbi:domain found in IF2B/IF5-domain-containing protein [Chytridium lagenaria]|nr:domain found in IF2B/IF5-domain-containing protein [Chytridium lagenaria]
MSNINIRRDVSDKFYRYKMPKLISKIEGKGNGIKTVVPNMADIAKSLARPPTYPTKFFGCELGAQVKCDEKNDRYIINGAHTADKLQDLLDGFINRFVLCGSCKNPETDLIIKGDDITRSCQACGANTPVDIRHKLCVFISKNPPITKKSSLKAHPSVKGAGSLATPDTASNDSNGDEDEGMAFDIGDMDVNGSGTINGKDDDDDWGQDTSEAAVRKRLQELAVGGAEGDDDPLEQFAEYVTSHVADDAGIIAKAAELSIRDDKVCVVLAQSEKCQKGLLGGIERLVGVVHTSLLGKTPLILKAFYDADLIEESVILAWGEKASKKFVERKMAKEIRTKAEPFLKWLKEAEEDDDDDDEEEDDE